MKTGYIFISLIAATLWTNGNAKPRVTADRSSGAAERDPDESLGGNAVAP